MGLDWGDGAYEETARQLAPAAGRAVERAGAVSGERVLDVGCGTGNAALIAARRGARVTGVDPAPRLLEAARQRAAEAGLDVQFLRGEAADLGVPDGRFDAAVAVFSVIFAPDPDAAVAGMVRAVRPGGRIVVATWITSGPIHEASRTMRDAMQPHAGPTPLSPWFEIDSLRALFRPHRAALDISEETLPFEGPSPEAFFEALELRHPFWRAARSFFSERPDTYADLRRKSIEILRDGNEVSSGFRATSRYRLVRAEIPTEG